jgi:hypothetical protein
MLSSRYRGVVGLAVFVTLLTSAPLRGADSLQSADDWLERFSQDWNENLWEHKSRKRPHGYMRPLHDRGWQTRMRVLRELVLRGQDAVGPLLNVLKGGTVHERVLAAQTLGLLAPDVPMEPLLSAAQTDKNTAVRLYAVDALGMRGSAGTAVKWDLLLKQARNRDVRKHIGYARERNNVPVASEVTAALRDWNPETIDTAVLGQPAPDFELASVNGEKVRLSDYRGRKAVVLVFVYGDT